MAPHVIPHAEKMTVQSVGYFTRAAARRAAAVLEAGGIAVLPTDTLYGFHCVASNARVVDRIRRLKERAGRGGRSRAGGFILLVADVAMAEGLVARWPRSTKRFLASVWPAPLTAVLPAGHTVSPKLAPRGLVALRVPAHRGLRSLIAAIGEPLVSTSVNVSGRPALARIADIRKAFPTVDVCISRRGRPGKFPSTVVDFTRRPPRLERAGAFPWRGFGGPPLERRSARRRARRARG